MLMYRLLIAFFFLPAIVSAEQDDVTRHEILALMDRAFAAISSNNREELRAIHLDNGTSTVFRPHPYKPDEFQMRLSTNLAFIEAGGDGDGEYLERWIEEPLVLINGPIAVVWGRYEFFVDGEFSHCGVDSVDVVKVDGQWKIANFVWTVETEGCTTAP